MTDTQIPGFWRYYFSKPGYWIPGLLGVIGVVLSCLALAGVG